jgi:hypothetical protein
MALDRNSAGEVGAPAPGALVGDNLPAWPPPPPNPSDAGPTPDPDPPPGDPGAPKTLTCEDYPQPRLFVENQSWWLRTPGKNGSDFGHAHMGACIPEGETLNQDTGFDVRVILHDNPGEVTYASLVVKGTDYETTVYKTGAELAGFTCPVGTCERWVKLPLRLADFQHSGLQEVRFRLFIREPDDQQMHTSLNWQVYVQNGATREDVTRRPWLRGKGWYTGAGYCEAALTSVPAPDAPLSGPWSPELRMVWHGEASDLPVTGHTVTLDPDFHATPPTHGTVLRQGAGPWEGTVLVDTLGLARGRHRLVSRADCDDPRGSTNSGVLVVTFNVAG